MRDLREIDPCPRCKGKGSYEMPITGRATVCDECDGDGIGELFIHDIRRALLEIIEEVKRLGGTSDHAAGSEGSTNPTVRSGPKAKPRGNHGKGARRAKRA